MIEALITSKTRLKILLKFFLNPSNSAYLRSLESDFEESTNGIRKELNRLEEANMLYSNTEGNRKVYTVNQTHPLYSEINSLVRKHVGLDLLVEKIVSKIGGLESVFLVGKLAQGLDDDSIDVILVGDINTDYLEKLLKSAKSILKKKINYTIYSTIYTAQSVLSSSPSLLLWNKE